MIVPEFIAKKYLARYGIATPRGEMVESAAEACRVAAQIDGEVAVKVQIASGKRGKAGGIRFAATAEDCVCVAGELLGSELLGYRVEQVLVEEKLTIAQELYVGLIIDRGSGKIQLILSLNGGIEIEDTGRAAIRTLTLEPATVLPAHRAARFLRAQNVDEKLVEPLGFVISALHRVFIDLDLVQIEINPLAVLDDGRMVALDCKMEVDDNALARQPEFARLHRKSLTAREARAAELGVSFVPLDGDIGLIASGAGLGMATLDLLRRAGLRPADFLDTGGGITTDLMREAVKLVMDSDSVRGLMINLYGGINPMIAAAEGICEGLKSLPARKPAVVKLLGNSQEEAWRILENVGVTVVKVAQTEKAVETLAERLGALREVPVLGNLNVNPN